jgi:predicted nuclease of predicted toxin-antitoxin system
VKGFLFDENLPARIEFIPSLPMIHVDEIGEHTSDTEIWNYARTNDLVIVSKDADFSSRIIARTPPPRVIHVRIGNMRKQKFHELLSRVWPQIEYLIRRNKLIAVYRDRVEIVA